jgi:hypothetical protein
MGLKLISHTQTKDSCSMDVDSMTFVFINSFIPILNNLRDHDYLRVGLIMTQGV